MVISGQVSTCDSVASWWLYMVAPLGNQATSIMTWYPTQSYNPETEPISPCPALIIPSAWLGGDKCKLLNDWFDSTSVQNRGFESRDLEKRGNRPSTHCPRLVDPTKSAVDNKECDGVGASCTCRMLLSVARRRTGGRRPCLAPARLCQLSAESAQSAHTPPPARTPGTSHQSLNTARADACHVYLPSALYRVKPL